MENSDAYTEVVLPLDDIEATSAVQVRCKIDKATVEDYTAAMAEGGHRSFPALIVFAEKGSERYLLADGFHRLPALKKNGVTDFRCRIYEGGIREALAYALKANDTHGLRRNNKDKRNAVEMALKDPEWGGWNNAKIAELCRVDPKTVAKVREDLVLSGDLEQRDTVKTERDGKVVERRAGRAASSGFPDERDSGEKSATKEKPAKQKLTPAQKQAADNVRRDAREKRLDESNKRTLVDSLDAIRMIPFSGRIAAKKWPDLEVAHIAYLRDWCDEFLKERAKKNAA